MRLTKCPVCGEKIEIDDGYGSMEICDVCPNNSAGETHYRYFMNIFSNSVRVLSEKIDLDSKKGREKWNKLVKMKSWE